ncbi:MAG: twin-arginine translocation signal domain-containing protein, partial [Chthoniobacteraceae bacterium]
MISRRSFLNAASCTGALAALGHLPFLNSLPRVSAEEAKLDPRTVQFHPGIEPLVRMLEDTPRDRVLEEVGRRIRAGLSYRELLAALLLAGVRDIQPRPVGFKFHAVLVVNSAHLASLASADSDRWLPIFWAIDQFKSSQAADVREGDWKMAPVDEAAVPQSQHAKDAFIQAMDNWDEAAADAAVVGLARSASADELFELFARYGSRDFRDIGHKAIYVANSFRTLGVIGWHHAEPVLRSLAYALLDRGGSRENPAQADLPADRPYRHNLTALGSIRPDWTGGKVTTEATRELLQALRTASSEDAGKLTVKLLNDGIAPRALFDGFFT